VKIRIAVGDVDVRLEGVDLTLRQVRGLIKYCVGASAAVAITSQPESDAQPETAHPLGFSATIERLPQEIPQEDLDWYFDE
jgi:hypothetical protein